MGEIFKSRLFGKLYGVRITAKGEGYKAEAVPLYPLLPRVSLPHDAVRQDGCYITTPYLVVK